MCKEDYAQLVKEILCIVTEGKPSASRGFLFDVGNYLEQRHAFSLDTSVTWSIIVLTNDRSDGRLQTLSPATAGHSPSSSGGGHRPAVCLQLVLRSSRLGAGQVRDDPPCSARPGSREPSSRASRTVSAIVLSGAILFPATRVTGPASAQTGAPGGPQVDAAGSGVCRRQLGFPPRSEVLRTGPHDPGQVRHRRTSANDRQGIVVASKKTPLTARRSQQTRRLPLEERPGCASATSRCAKRFWRPDNRSGWNNNQSSGKEWVLGYGPTARRKTLGCRRRAAVSRPIPPGSPLPA